jgi:hypothetical protein
VEKIGPLLGYVTAGILDLSAATGAVIALKPSVIIAGISGISAKKALVVELSSEAAETEPTLTIPHGLTLTVSGTLESVTSLVVNGSLNASSATLDTASATVKVGPGASAVLDEIATLGASSVGAGGALTAEAAAFAAEAALDVAAGAAVNGVRFPAATGITALEADALTIGDLTIPAAATFTIPEDKTVTVPADKTLTVQGKLVFAAASSTLSIEEGGTLTAAATAVFGNNTTVDGSGISLQVTDGTDESGYTSTSDEPVVITTAAADDGAGTDKVIGNASFAKLAGVSTAAPDDPVTSTAAADAAAGGIQAGSDTVLVITGS